MFEFLSSINILAVAVSAIVYFILGAVWYMPSLFGTMWKAELARHNISFNPPTSAEMMQKTILSLIVNVIMVLAVAFVVQATATTALSAALVLGIKLAVGFAATTLGITYIWQNKSFKLFLLDAGYPMVGVILSTIILALWH